MPAFVSFTCRHCGDDLATLEDVQNHEHHPEPVTRKRDEGYLRGHEQAVSRETRSKRDRINRLRTRLLAAGPQPHPTHVAAVLHGILDLLGDEL